MMTAATLFTGFGGADLGMQDAGLDVLWGIEKDPDIADVARRNGLPVQTGDVTSAPPSLPHVEAIHMSPPCPNFSVAKTGAKESSEDVALARACVSFIRALQPEIVTLENVWGYRKSRSWSVIRTALTREGYAWAAWHINMADYGVPQTRKRMIVAALKGGPRPTKPQPTHAEDPPAPGLFGDTLKPWVGWYESIEDLIPTLPESEFAPWQLDRLPDEVTCLLGVGQRSSPCFADEPASTVTSNSNQVGVRALLVDGDNAGKEGEIYAASKKPSKTISQSTCPKAFLANGTSTVEVRAARQQAAVQTASHNNLDTRALLVSSNSIDGGAPALRRPTETSVTVDTKAERTRAIAGGRVVRMTPRCHARFQTFPDVYALPDRNGLACKGIGNACPPLFIRRLYEHLL